MKEICIKMLKTFVQGFIGYLISLSVLPENTDKGIQMIVIGAVAAGLSALMNINYKELEKNEEVILIGEEVGEDDVQ